MDMYSNFYPQPNQMGYNNNNIGGYRSNNSNNNRSRNNMMDGGQNRQNFYNSDNQHNNSSSSTSSSSSNTLWMGNIDNSMDENLIQNAFNIHGFNVHNIKIIRNKDNGLPLGYGFVSFDDRSTAQDVLRELNGKKIPNVQDDKRFFLKRANRSGRFSVFVGNLPPQINNESLLNTFLTYYRSVSSAKVIMNDGISKGFGFVSFDDEYDYYNALNQQSLMLGTNPISVSKARNNNQGNKSRFNNNNNQNVRQNYNNNYN